MRLDHLQLVDFVNIECCVEDWLVLAPIDHDFYFSASAVAFYLGSFVADSTFRRAYPSKLEHVYTSP